MASSETVLGTAGYTVGGRRSTTASPSSGAKMPSHAAVPKTCAKPAGKASCLSKSAMEDPLVQVWTCVPDSVSNATWQLGVKDAGAARTPGFTLCFGVIRTL